MGASYATPHNLVYALSHYAAVHIQGVKPHQLIAALVERTGRPLLQIAAEMGKTRTFQATLYRFTTGQVANPSRGTAKRIATYFDLPIEAIYDAHVAAQIARDRGLRPPLPSGQQVEEPTRPYLDAAKAAEPTISAQLSWPAPDMQERISRLNDAQRAHLNALVRSFLDAVTPESPSSKRRAAA